MDRVVRVNARVREAITTQRRPNCHADIPIVIPESRNRAPHACAGRMRRRTW
jgi:hypothetical protein